MVGKTESHAAALARLAVFILEQRPCLAEWRHVERLAGEWTSPSERDPGNGDMWLFAKTAAGRLFWRLDDVSLLQLLASCVGEADDMWAERGKIEPSLEAAIDAGWMMVALRARGAPRRYGEVDDGVDDA